MSAAAALAHAEAAGLCLRLRPDGRVRVEAAAPPPDGLLAELRRWRDDVAQLLSFRDGITSLPRQRPVSAKTDWRALPYGQARGEAFAAAKLAPRACRCCAGRHWWQEAQNPTGWRCVACHPPIHLPEGQWRLLRARDE